MRMGTGIFWHWRSRSEVWPRSSIKDSFLVAAVMAVTARIVAEHGSLNHIRQVAPTYTHVIHGSLGQNESALWTASWSIRPFLQGSTSRPTEQRTDRQTDHATSGPLYQWATSSWWWDLSVMRCRLATHCSSHVHSSSSDTARPCWENDELQVNYISSSSSSIHHHHHHHHHHWMTWLSDSSTDDGAYCMQAAEPAVISFSPV